jgi:hypothetical protein
MVKFGSNTFAGFGIPLAFGGRYFIVEPSSPTPLMSVVLVDGGKVHCEVLRNQPSMNTQTTVTMTPPGIITVADKATGSFVYKMRPGSETSVVFGRLNAGDMEVTISDKALRIGGSTLSDNLIMGCLVGVQVRPDGSFSMGGGSVPDAVVRWLGQSLGIGPYAAT